MLTILKKINFVFASILLLLLLAIAGIGVYYYQSQKESAERQAHEEYQKVTQEYEALTRTNVNFNEASKELEAALERYPDGVVSRSRGITKIMLGDSLSEIDPQKGTEILKEVARNSEYPADIRARAINFIVNDYELNFIDRDFAVHVIFTGDNFEKLLTESNGDEELAMRKLNEWSSALSPGVIANYRIAKWYADHLYRSPTMPEDKKTELTIKMNEHVSFGDTLLSRYKNIMAPQRIGLAYELKARIIYLSGGDTSEADEFYKLAIETYLLPPQNIFQTVYLTRSSLYRVAFLTRNYGVEREEYIKRILNHYYEYLSVPQAPEKRNVRLVSFLIAARDSKQMDYPNVDFNRTDIENIKKYHPKFGALIDTLDLKEYVKGHPIETQLKNI